MKEREKEKEGKQTGGMEGGKTSFSFPLPWLKTEARWVCTGVAD